ncbi:MAG: chaperone modulator CbpM [Roseiflexaceae bacterium]|nr:chaperone modulator CbpM [Roseiflexaceae bacterium]
MPTDTTFNREQLAAQIGLPVQLVQDLFDNGVISLRETQREADLRELRRARRLRDDLELQHAAITIILRLRQRTLALQHEITQLQRAARTAPTSVPHDVWSEAEWLILAEDQ